MNYRKFIIKNYRAIIGPLEVNLQKNTLIPIIGVNECGKTTILQALLAFDPFNDDLNAGQHLKDTSNLYTSMTFSPTITAEIELDQSDFVDALEIAEKVVPLNKAKIATYRRKRRQFPSVIQITRNLRTDRLSFESLIFNDRDLNHNIAAELVRCLPYILYFDDFRDAVEDRVEILPSTDSTRSPWLPVLAQLFKNTYPSYSIYHLPDLEERKRKTILARVKKKLNDTLTKEWQHFRLDDKEALEISFDFSQEVTYKPATPKPGTTSPATAAAVPGSMVQSVRNFLKINVIETDQHGHEHYFFIRDRSKGFFWFFNFVLKLEFNPKMVDDDTGAVYLLDEPGSYLHASAQAKLCAKLRQISRKNNVIYCTHSHYLLNPEIIPFSSIKIADKDIDGNVKLVSIHDHVGTVSEKRSAFQPIVDALQIKPFLLDLNLNSVLIVEGIYDFYSFDMFRGGRLINILPSVNADSIKFYISMMIAWRVKYLALWDNDEEGRNQRKKTLEVFGEEEGASKFFLLPDLNGASKPCRLENLFDAGDLAMTRTNMGIPGNSSFEKTIAALYHSSTKHDILNKFSTTTKQNFEKVFSYLGL